MCPHCHVIGSTEDSVGEGHQNGSKCDVMRDEWNDVFSPKVFTTWTEARDYIITTVLLCF